MPIEIERKFLVVNDSWRRGVVSSQHLRQGYIARTRRGSTRVRQSDSSATIAVKGPRRGLVRQEFEYPIPVEDAEAMLRDLCVKPLVEKVRHLVTHAGTIWEVDVYAAAELGLVLAEIELTRPDQAFVRPDWIGREVTHDPRFRNFAIARGKWRTALHEPPTSPPLSKPQTSRLRPGVGPEVRSWT